MKIPPLKNSEKLCYYTLCMLGVVCIWRLNDVADRFTGSDRMLSPLILLLCLFGVFQTPKIGYLRAQGRQSLFFLSSLALYLGVGALSAFLLDDKANLVGVLSGVGATIVLIASVVHMASGLIMRGHHLRILRLTFYLSLMATLGVFVGFFVPGLANFFGVKAAGRMTGFYHNPNMFALQTLITITFAYTLASYTLKSSYLIIGYAAGIPAILLTNSRTALLVMMALTITLSVYVFPPKYVVRAALSFLILSVVFISTFVYLQSVRSNTSTNWVQQKLARRTEGLFDLLRGRIDEDNTGGRLILAKEAISIWKKNPLLGNGLGTLDRMPVHRIGPHNTYLKYLGESGIFVMLLFAGAFLMFGLRGVTMTPRWCQVLIIGMFLVCALACMTSHIVLQQRHINFCLAIGFAFSNQALESILVRDGKGRQFVFFKNPQSNTPQPLRHPGMGQRY